MKQFVVCGLLSVFVMGISGCTTKPVEIIGHRGASYIAPENTMASFTLGWKKTSAVELDIYLTRDNRIVVIHDSTTKRTAGVDMKVAESTSEELRKLDVGSFKSPEYAGERIPFLEDVVRAIPPGRKLYIEIKCGKEVLPPLRELLIRSGKISQVVIIGFDLEVVTESKKLIDVPTYWLKGTDKDKQTEQWIPHDPKLADEAKSRGLDGLDVHNAGVTKEFARAVKASGLKLYVWTVDDPQEAQRLIELGVDGITTNRPGWLAEQLKNRAHGK
jgi:glycerophosphoryl diester phosphodiesterase